MTENIKNLNIRRAIMLYGGIDDGTGKYAGIEPFAEYSPAYVLTNENVRWVSGLTAHMAKNILTVAASGDQAMFYAMHGAKNIDTFDISFCAKVAMDIKTAAVHHLSRNQYIKMLADMYEMPYAPAPAILNDIIKYIPESSRYFVQQMRNCGIFRNGIKPSYYAEYFPTDHEYAQMRHNINGPFNFIWTDLSQLHINLCTKYDVINLSNIFEYMKFGQIHTILNNLRTYTAQNGYIIAQTGHGLRIKEDMYKYLAKLYSNWAHFELVRQNIADMQSERAVIIQRIR